MNIIAKSENLTAVDLYFLTKCPDGQGMKNAVGQTLDVRAWCIVEDDRSGEPMKICCLMTEEGEVYATNSSTFCGDFSDIVNMLVPDGVEIKKIRVEERVSKKNRPFLSAIFVPAEPCENCVIG